MRRLSAVIAAATALAALPAIAGNPPPTFTGDVEVDFVNVEVIPAPDPGGTGDVGLPDNFPPGRISGWNLIDMRFFYDRANDVMYVGLNFAGIAGDADGDGDPGGTSPELAENGGTDVPSLGLLESIVLSLDTDRDGLPNVVVGVPALDDVTGFTAALAIPENPPMFAFGAPLPQHTGILFADPSAAAPDFEFTIPEFSKLPGYVDIDPEDDSIIAFARVFAGSIQDDGVGEDVITPKVIAFGKVGFDDEPQGTLITDQYANEGLTIRGMSDCGIDGAFINDPSDNPTTDDILPTSGMNVITTRCDPADDTSDSGVLDFDFVNPFDGMRPAGVIFFSIAFLDVEDSGDPGRGTSSLQFIGLDGSVIQTDLIPSGPNGNQFVAEFPLSAAAAPTEPVGKVVGTLGDPEDSVASDTICYNIEPPDITLTIDIEGPVGSSRRGDLMEVFVHVTNVTAVPQNAIALVTAGRSPAGSKVQIVPPTPIRFRARFDNKETPVPLRVGIPRSLDPRLVGVELLMRAKLIDPASGKIIAQDVYKFSVSG